MRERYQTWADIERRASHLDSYLASGIQAARAKDAAERAEREAAYEARVQRDHDEIVELTAKITRLSALLDWALDAHAAVRAKDAAEIARLREALSRCKRGHYYCEDSWYSCPLAEGGCADDSKAAVCDCGAEAFNAEIDVVLGLQ